MKAQVICAWCGKFMYYGETTDGSPSHGLCHACLHKHFPDFAEALDPPEPTPDQKTHPNRHYVRFGRSPHYHITDDDFHTLCGKLIVGHNASGYHLGVITPHQPDNEILCSMCRAVVNREHSE